MSSFKKIICAALCAPFFINSHASSIPRPVNDAPLSTTSGQATAVFAGGCFWGMQAVFQHVKGVSQVLSGYAGGTQITANYPTVSSGITSHAEAIKISYDPSKVSYGQLLQVFFSVAHNPTELNRQGPDTGTQYRSAIFYADTTQQHIAQNYIAQLDRAHTFAHPIVTQNVPLRTFYVAEAYHQDYLNKHPDSPYIIYNDAPKLVDLQTTYPSLYKP